MATSSVASLSVAMLPVAMSPVAWLSLAMLPVAMLPLAIDVARGLQPPRIEICGWRGSWRGAPRDPRGRQCSGPWIQDDVRIDGSTNGRIYELMDRRIDGPTDAPTWTSERQLARRVNSSIRQFVNSSIRQSAHPLIPPPGSRTASAHAGMPASPRRSGRCAAWPRSARPCPHRGCSDPCCRHRRDKSG